jgi:tetratricopeptide (TPR) repeat protein
MGLFGFGKSNDEKYQDCIYNGDRAFEKELYDVAVKCYNAAIVLNPENAEGWFGKSMPCVMLKLYEEAIACLNEALRLDPENVDAWVSKSGLMALTQEKYEESIMCADAAIRLNPEEPMAWVNKGTALSKLKRNNEALRCFDEALRLDPENTSASKNKVLVLEILFPGANITEPTVEQLEEAISHIRPLDHPEGGTPTKNDIPKIIFGRALIFFYAKNYSSSLIEFKKVLEYDDNDEETKMYIKQCTEKLSED